MALIKCSECGKEISDKATACPNCGNPITQVNKNLVQIDTAPQKRKKYRVGFLISVPIFLIGGTLSIIWGFSAISGGEKGQLGLWLFVAFIGFLGVVVNGIGGWLNKP